MTFAAATIFGRCSSKNIVGDGPSRVARTLLVRFHSFGDVVLSTGIAGALALAEGEPIDIGVDAPWTALFEGLDSVARIWTRDELTAAAESGRRWDSVIDLQGNIGSRTLARRLGPSRHLAGWSTARRWVVVWGDRFPRPAIPHVLLRYAVTAGLDATHRSPESLAPRVSITPAALEALAREAPALAPPADSPRVALLAGASRGSKRIPNVRFAELARRLEADGFETHLFLAPGDEAAAFDGPAFVHRLGLRALVAALAACHVAVSNDSGPMHLASAVGTPVVALFGSSVPALGFAPVGSPSRLLARTELSCRPCGVHGRDRCWLGHWACLDLDVSQMRDAVRALLAMKEPEASLSRDRVS